jgi:hypothetical protein
MRRHRGVSLQRIVADLNPLLRGWAGYFGFSQWRELASLDGWTRRRLRCVVWVQWKTRGNRYRELRRMKVSDKVASAAIFGPKGPCGGRARRARCIAPSPTDASRILGCFPWKHWRALNPPNRRGTDPYARWCERGGVVRRPLSRLAAASTAPPWSRPGPCSCRRSHLLLFLVFTQIVHVQVARTFQPVLMYLDRQCQNQPQTALAAGEDPKPPHADA